MTVRDRLRAVAVSSLLRNLVGAIVRSISLIVGGVWAAEAEGWIDHAGAWGLIGCALAWTIANLVYAQSLLLFAQASHLPMSERAIAIGVAHGLTPSLLTAPRELPRLTDPGLRPQLKPRLSRDARS